jgi:CheY-like chemotaxis protein
VVDDNRDLAQGLARLLMVLGHEVDVAYDGPEGLDRVRTFRPDVLLLDIGLPRMDGYEVAQRVRKEEGLEGLRIIAITGYGQDDDRLRSKKAGIDHHLVKPIVMSALAALVSPLTRDEGAGASTPGDRGRG